MLNEILIVIIILYLLMLYFCSDESYLLSGFANNNLFINPNTKYESLHTSFN
jgi:hypothetical protein